MNQLFQKTSTLALIALTGCAVVRPTNTPVAPPPITPPATQEASPKPAPKATPGQRARKLLNGAYSAVDAGHRTAALDSLALLSDLLIATFDPTSDQAEHTDPITRETAENLTRATVDLYFDAQPGSAPIPPSAPLARLIAALPEGFRSALEINKRYRHLYTRVLAGTSPIRIDVNDRVLEKIAFFQKNNQRIFRTWMRRLGTYGPLIRQTLRDEGLPEDLLFLSMIESGFNTKAYSRARAVGMWQFVSHTGRLYGLRRDTWIDERRDPEKATHAAARHMRHLYNIFGDWQLVISAYNCGQGRLQRAMRTDGTHDFWEMDSLPRETRNHLPKFMAVLLMSRDPEFFGVHNLVSDEPLAFDLVQVADPIDLRLAAQCAGTTYERMRTLNPELRLGYSPPVPNRKTYALRVPIGKSERFLDRYARIPDDRKVQLIDYTVRSGDTISNIAVAFGIRSSVIMDANGIRNPRRLRAGKKIKIPIHPKQSRHAQALAKRSAPRLEQGSGDKLVYRVKRGDTLWDIARSQGVTPDQIRAWNALRATGHIHPGDKLTIWASETQTTSSGTRALASVDRFHKVRRGDTLWEIARIYDTSIRELKRLNGISNASRIKAGDRIRVRSASAAVE